MRAAFSVPVLAIVCAAMVVLAAPVPIAASVGPKATPGKTLRLKVPGAKRVDLKLVPTSARRGCRLLACDGALLHGLRRRGGSVRIRWPSYYQRCASGCSAAATATFELAAWRRGQKVIVFFLRSSSRPSGKPIGRARATIRRTGPSRAVGPEPLPPPSGTGGGGYLSRAVSPLRSRHEPAASIAAALSPF